MNILASIFVVNGTVGAGVAIIKTKDEWQGSYSTASVGFV